MFWLHCTACRVSQFPDQGLNGCPGRWKRRAQRLDPGAPGSSAPTPSGRSHCPAHPGRIPNPHQPPHLPPRLREQDVSGETLPAACRCRPMSRPPNPDPSSSSGPSQASFRHRCPTGATETRMAPLIGAASRDLPPECQMGTALSPGRPGLCSVTPTAGSFSVLRSLQVTPNPMAVSRLLRAWNPGAATPPKSRRGAGPRSRGTSRPGWRGCGWSGSWLGGLPQLHTCGSLHGWPPAPAARWTGGGLHKVGRGPEPAQSSSPPSPCHCPISLG